MKKTNWTLCLASLLGFAGALTALLLVFSENNASIAQTIPLLQRQRTGIAQNSQTQAGQNLQVASDVTPNSKPRPPIPETRSMLPIPNESPLYVARYAELIPEERVSIEVYERCNKSVVNIDTRTTYNILFLGEMDEPGAGSGVVLDAEGHVLTNSHVISKVDSITVTLFNGESFPAKLVGEDSITDLAVLKIDAPKELLRPVVLSDSSRLLVGQKIFAIGNPFGLERTLTSGLISSLNRSIPSRVEARSIKGLIQIDAAINPGNSGGALLDTQGRMIGINTAIASQSGGSHGVGFAIPANTVSRIVPQLIRNGKVIRGDIGIINVREAERDKTRGLLVLSMIPDGAAEKAGLRNPKVVRERALFRGTPIGERSRIDMNAADLIVGVNGVETKKADDFTAIVDDHKPGDRIVLDVIRNKQRIQIPVVLR